MSNEQYDKLRKQLDLWEYYYKTNKIIDKVTKSNYHG